VCSAGVPRFDRTARFCRGAHLTTYRDHGAIAEEGPLSDYVVRPQEPDTWNRFAWLAERHNGVLYNGTRVLFERAGFEFVRSKGMGNCVMRRTVP